jgi:hypothetical protein
VRRALLEWIPEKVTAPHEDLLNAPETLRILLRYLEAHGLHDQRGAAVEENESAIDAVVNEFADAICWGVCLSGSSAGPLRARSGNSPSFL